ncbi:NADPH:quinone oxidoreductase-like [Neltuma alba]|uniref:NADPH:quinone oxidoreductase-like n=1 Tax=Neltuma alba TaxID=207710 RepID=UPI0010A4A9D5|nr:NADPH:quinone oxidoreductase-like [Prosopis alba]
MAPLFSSSLRKSQDVSCAGVRVALRMEEDCASRTPNVWAGKAAAVVSTGGSSGEAKAQHHLHQVGVFIDLHFLNKPDFFLSAFQPPAKFNADGDLIDEEAKIKLKKLLLSRRNLLSDLKAKLDQLQPSQILKIMG